MKLYDSSDAIETLAGILSVQPSRTLAENLANIMIRYSDKQNSGWHIKDFDISVKKVEDKYSIKIGDEE
jgi:hypothetical protein